MKTIRLFALLAMILGVLCIPVVLYFGVGNLISKNMHYRMYDGSPHIYVHAARIAMYKLMAGLLVCQVLIGGGGFVRWKLKKLLAAQPTT